MLTGNLDGYDNDHVAGWAFDAERPARPVPVDVQYNGRRITSTVAAFPRPDLVRAGVGAGANGFCVALPVIEAPETAEVVATFSDTGQQVGESVKFSRRPRCSPAGVLASDMLRLHRIPLHSVQGLAFDGERLVVSGLHLPPGGNPFGLRITSSPGVSFTTTYPVHLPAVNDWYWYWPNSAWSGFRIEIDLAESAEPGPHYAFRLELDGEDADADVDVEVFERNVIYVPNDLDVYQRFPRGDQLTRVHRFDDRGRVALAGYTDFRRLVAVAEQHGVDLPNATVLDWGCGHGRVIRHFHQQGCAKEAWAVDIDADNVGWLGKQFPEINASHVPLLPPTDLPDAHFDLVYAISVMTHLTHEAQQAWLGELRRVLKPGGLALLTYCGPTAAAFASRFHDPEWFSAWTSTGFDDRQANHDLDDLIDDNDYYRNTKQSAAETRERWSQHLDTVALHDCIFGYQDLAVLQKPAEEAEPGGGRRRV